LVAIGTAAAYGLERVYGRRETRQILVTLILLGISVGVSFVAAEAVVRYAFRNVSVTPGESYFTFRFRQQQPPISNRWGFRERNVSPEPTNNTYRIAIVGDSLTYAAGVALDRRLTGILESHLNSLGKGRYEVINFGRPGTETVDHVEILKTYVFGVFPDYVLLQWFVNDVEGFDHSKRPTPWRLVPSETLIAILRRHSALELLSKVVFNQMNQAAA
jgi:hypothetical protein